MGRRRSERKAGFPDNLYESGGYFSWRNPVTRETFGLGRDRKQAFEEAKAANAHVASQRQSSLVDRITKAKTFNDFIPALEESLAQRDSAVNTRRTRAVWLRSASARFGDVPIASVATSHVEDALRSYREQGKLRSAQAFRSFLIDAFRVAEAKGWIPRGTNPALITEKVKVAVKRQRLKVEVFFDIYEAAKRLDPWVRNSMALALVTAQRREDIAEMMFRPMDHATAWVEGGTLWVVQQKTKARVAIELALFNNALGMSVGEVVEQCRDRVVSRYLVHHTKARTKSRLGDPVHKDTISRAFARARLLAGIADSPQAPTFHEIRALAKSLYDEQDINTKDLLGHKTDKMAALYADPREAAWVRVG